MWIDHVHRRCTFMLMTALSTSLHVWVDIGNGLHFDRLSGLAFRYEADRDGAAMLGTPGLGCQRVLNISHAVGHRQAFSP